MRELRVAQILLVSASAPGFQPAPSTAGTEPEAVLARRLLKEDATTGRRVSFEDRPPGTHLT